LRAKPQPIGNQQCPSIFLGANYLDSVGHCNVKPAFGNGHAVTLRDSYVRGTSSSRAVQGGIPHRRNGRHRRRRRGQRL
jgi:hypothetical protein